MSLETIVRGAFVVGNNNQDGSRIGLNASNGQIPVGGVSAITVLPMPQDNQVIGGDGTNTVVKTFTITTNRAIAEAMRRV